MNRYINAGNLLTKIKAYRPYQYLGEDALSYAIKMVELEPSADVRENVRGEWIEDNPRDKSMMWRCSVCGRIAYYPTIGERKSYKKHCGYNYCPNCGADMRDGEADDESRIN